MPVLLSLVMLCMLMQWSPVSMADRHGEPLKNVSLELLWKHQFQFAGYYVAKEKGYYKDVGLNVDIKEFESGVDATRDILTEKTDFAVGRSSILIKHAKDNKLVGLFAAFQQSPLMLLTRASSNIKSPADLKSKNIMMTEDAGLVAEVRAMMLQSGLTEHHYVRQKHSFNVDDLINGTTDAMGSYVSNEPFKMQRMGVDYTVLHPKDYGFEVYSDILYTSQKFINTNPALTARFYAASIKGWRYAFNHIEETVDIILEKYNTQNKTREALLFEARELKKLAFDENGQFGSLSAARLQDVAQMYLVLGLLNKNYNIDNFIYKGTGDRAALGLTLGELKYLHNKKRITMCVGPHRMPYEQILEGKHVGMIADYIEFISNKLNIPITLVPTTSWQQSHEYAESKKCDILSAVIPTDLRSKHFNFTKPYFDTPFGVASLTSENMPSSLNGLRGKRLAMVKGCALEEILPKENLGATFYSVDSELAGLRLVQNRAVDGFIHPVAVLGYAMQAHQMTDIKITGNFDNNWRASIAVHKDDPKLPGILNKAISTLTEADHQRFFNKWASIKYEHRFDFTLLWQVVAAMLAVVLILAYRYKIISGYNKKLAVLAEKDKLTGVYNRHKTDALLNNLVEVARRYDRPLSLIYLDVDHFKRINDTYGHEAGDSVLIELASIVNKQIRKSDVFGRWGGEEFLVIIPETDVTRASLFAGALRKKINAYNFSVDEKLTCSFGVAQFNAEDTVESFVKRADDALYKAKDSGRDCIKN